jgi:hypothetical protein
MQKGSKFGTQKTNRPNRKLSFMRRGVLGQQITARLGPPSWSPFFLFTHIPGIQSRWTKKQSKRPNACIQIPTACALHFVCGLGHRQAHALPGRLKKGVHCIGRPSSLTFSPSSGGWGFRGPLLHPPTSSPKIPGRAVEQRSQRGLGGQEGKGMMSIASSTPFKPFSAAPSLT